MISNIDRAESELEKQVAERYSEQGFNVTVNPRENELPFSLGSYGPDLIAVKNPSEKYIVEIKGSNSPMPIDRYRDIAEVVSEHPGWKFLLVKDKDVSALEKSPYRDRLLTWQQVRDLQSNAKNLLESGQNTAAFLVLWGAFEAALRRQAEQSLIPVERLPTSSLIKHLYSQGELSLDQFDVVTNLEDARNRIVHGYQVSEIKEASNLLDHLLSELTLAWGQP